MIGISSQRNGYTKKKSGECLACTRCEIPAVGIRGRILPGRRMLRNVTRPMSLANLRNHVRFSSRFDAPLWRRTVLMLRYQQTREALISGNDSNNDDLRSRFLVSLADLVIIVTRSISWKIDLTYRRLSEWERTYYRIVILIIKCRSLQNLRVALIVIIKYFNINIYIAKTL